MYYCIKGIECSRSCILRIQLLFSLASARTVCTMCSVLAVATTERNIDDTPLTINIIILSLKCSTYVLLVHSNGKGNMLHTFTGAREPKEEKWKSVRRRIRMKAFHSISILPSLSRRALAGSFHRSLPLNSRTKFTKQEMKHSGLGANFKHITLVEMDILF